MSVTIHQDGTGDYPGQTPDSVRMVTGLRATNQALAWIGAKSGVFARFGVNVSFPMLEVGGPECVAGLLRGDWDFVQTGTVPIAEAVLNGHDPVILLRDSVLCDQIVIMTRPGITSLAQLNGRRVGILIDAYSGQTGVFARRAIEREGAAATYVGLGTYRNTFAGLEAGDIDAAALPIDYQIIEQGRNRWNCFEAHSLRIPAILATTRRAIAADRNLVLRVVRGVIEVMHRFRTKDSAILPLLQEFLQIADRSAVERLRDHYATVLPLIPRPALLDGIEDLRAHFMEKYPAARYLQENDIVDSSLIDELEQGGFVGND